MFLQCRIVKCCCVFEIYIVYKELKSARRRHCFHRFQNVQHFVRLVLECLFFCGTVGLFDLRFSDFVFELFGFFDVWKCCRCAQMVSLFTLVFFWSLSIENEVRDLSLPCAQHNHEKEVTGGHRIYVCICIYVQTYRMRVWTVVLQGPHGRWQRIALRGIAGSEIASLRRDPRGQCTSQRTLLPPSPSWKM